MTCSNNLPTGQELRLFQKGETYGYREPILEPNYWTHSWCSCKISNAWKGGFSSWAARVDTHRIARYRRCFSGRVDRSYILGRRGLRSGLDHVDRRCDPIADNRPIDIWPRRDYHGNLTAG